MWIIKYDKDVYSKIKRLRSNSTVSKKLDVLISDIKHLRDDDDPEMLGRRKRGAYKRLYGARLTGSYRLLYRIDYDLSLIHI